MQNMSDPAAARSTLLSPYAAFNFTLAEPENDVTGGTNSSNGTDEKLGWEYSVLAGLGLSSLVLILVFATVFGNCLVIIAVLTRPSLKAPQNLFLVSLATADILVATLVIPFSLFNELMGYWYFGRVWCEIYLALDVLFCTSSIVHLCAISLDRYWSVSQAVEYNIKRTPRRIKRIIVIVWFIAIAISLPPLISMNQKNWQQQEEVGRPNCELNTNTWYILGSSIGSFFAPCLIMVLVYARIYHLVKWRAAKLRRDKEAPITSCRPMESIRMSEVNGNGGGGGGGEGNGNGEKNCNGAGNKSRHHPHHHPPHHQHPSSHHHPEVDVEETSVSSDKNERRRDDASAGAKASRKPCSPTKDDYNPEMEILERQNKARERRKIAQARERRFTFVLSVMIGVFVICWFPFFFTYSLSALCSPEFCVIPETLFKFFFWFGYCNSCLNPVIYTVFNRDFRRAFKKILCMQFNTSF